jgi:hypothetical protein
LLTADSHSVLSLLIIKYGSSLLWKKIYLLPLSHMLLDLSFITVLQYLNLRSAIFRSLLRPLRAVVMMPVLPDGSYGAACSPVYRYFTSVFGIEKTRCII